MWPDQSLKITLNNTKYANNKHKTYVLYIGIYLGFIVFHRANKTHNRSLSIVSMQSANGFEKWSGCIYIYMVAILDFESNVTNVPNTKRFRQSFTTVITWG